MQNDDNEEEYVKEELGPPPRESLVKEEVKNTDIDEEGYVNDDMGPPKKVHINVEKGH